MGCQYLNYRTSDEFDHERAYCELADEFVAPLHADICNGRHEWTPETHCEIFRKHDGLDN